MIFKKSFSSSESQFSLMKKNINYIYIKCKHFKIFEGLHEWKSLHSLDKTLLDIYFLVKEIKNLAIWNSSTTDLQVL